MSRAQLADLLQLLVRYIGFDLEFDPDPLVSIANVLVEGKKSVQIKIAFQRRLDFFDVNAARRGVIDHGRSQTRCEGVKQMFDGISASVLPEQDWRLIGLQHKGFRSRLLPASTVKGVRGRGVLATVHPLVMNAKLEFRDGRSCLDDIDGFIQVVNRDSVDRLCSMSAVAVFALFITVLL